MSEYSLRYRDDDRRNARGRNIARDSPASNLSQGRKTKWSGTPSRYKNVGREKLDTIITGHLTPEQIDAYQQYFRIEEISDILRISQQLHRDIMSLLPSGRSKEIPNYKRDPSPPPKYDNAGNRTNTREARTREALEKERHYLVEFAASSIKDYISPYDYRKPTKTFEKLYIPVKDYPDINFVGLLLGPRGNTLRSLQDESGAKLAIRGKGSVKDGKSTSSGNDNDEGNSSFSLTSFSNPNLESTSDDLHVVVTADSQQKIATAIKLTNQVIEKAISSPVGQNDLKRGQLRELAILNGTLRETKPFDPESYQKRQQARQGLDISQIVCKICGKVGHFARDCKFKNQRAPFNGDDQNQRPFSPRAEQEGQRDGERAGDREEPSPPLKRKKPNAPLPPWQSEEIQPERNQPPPAISGRPPPPPAAAIPRPPPPPPSLNIQRPPPPPAVKNATGKPPPPPPRAPQ
ncbi:uncharacterized protein PRCAT00003836001 [Priceomyces carsonii]|uniref:uncharacterized protein n=1 Tax=Priceomyces carsonii TaxID=28549 RepID=UPI002EDAD704|nr:unnamed protein product [Priceomyces carsonii]